MLNQQDTEQWKGENSVQCLKCLLFHSALLLREQGKRMHSPYCLHEQEYCDGIPAYMSCNSVHVKECLDKISLADV